MKRTLIFFEILCMIFFLLFSSVYRRTQFLTSLAGPGMLSLVKQASAKATASENFSTDTTAGLPVEEPPRIALTFDDGPSPLYTERLLDGLKERGVVATFFVTGENAQSCPDLIRREKADGHLIGNHTYSHIQLTSDNKEVFREELVKTNKILKAITGENVTYIRPPYGSWDKSLEQDLNMFPVLWNVDPLDWCTPDAGLVMSRVLQQVEDGDIILLHDYYDTSVTAALMIVDEMKKQGYEFVTVEEILFD